MGGYPDREAYPCFYEQVAYGLAINGFAYDMPTLPVHIDVDRQTEPNIRNAGTKAVAIYSTVTVRDLEAGKSYVLYRYSGFNGFPAKDFEQGYEHKVPFTAEGKTWTYEDPKSFMSNGATYYVAVPAETDVQV